MRPRVMYRSDHEARCVIAHVVARTMGDADEREDWSPSIIYPCSIDWRMMFVTADRRASMSADF